MKKSIVIFLTSITLLSSPSYAQFDIFHPIKSAEKALLIGAVGYVAIKGTAEYLIAHPNTISNWLETHPNEIQPLTEYVDKKIDTAKTPEEYNKYISLKQQLALDVDNNISESAVLESEPDWQTLKHEVEQAIAQTDVILVQNNNINQSCNISVIESLMLPYKQFESTVNVILPKSQNNRNLK